jgi:hypothetical protein
MCHIIQCSGLVCRISEEEYIKVIKSEIEKVAKIQEELDIDVLVHGEPEVSSFCCILALINVHGIRQSKSNFHYCFREMIWLSTLASNLMVLPSPKMAGFNRMDLDV